MALNDFLEHHGIRGQRWGIRNKINPKTGRVVSKDHAEAAPLRKKHVSELTNKELKVANERGNLEQNFRRLNPTTTQKGSKATKKFLATFGVTTVIGFLNSSLGKKTMEKGRNFIIAKSLRVKQ